MKVIKNIYLNENVVFGAGYPYEDAQEEVLMVKNDRFIIEFDDESFFTVFLDNKKIEYSLEIKTSNINDSSNLMKLKGTIFDHILGQRITEIKYLHLVNEIEFITNQYPTSEELFFNRIGIRYLFENENELYMYSAEPEMILDGTYKMFRPDSVICLILFDYKNGKIKPIDKSEFCDTFLETKTILGSK